jgi:hypothetical protein
MGKCNFYRIIGAAVFLLAVESCVMDSARVYLQYPKTNPKVVEIINRLPGKNYVLVADFQCVNASHNWIKKKASTYGADAVYVASFAGSTTQDGRVLTQRTPNAGIYKQQFCSAIKYVNSEQ